jgi:hypothetical protein
MAQSTATTARHSSHSLTKPGLPLSDCGDLLQMLEPAAWGYGELRQLLLDVEHRSLRGGSLPARSVDAAAAD